jgi:CMP-N-acetylneuraminic acid synthetase
VHSVAIIPARGGSKRLPGKNLRPFAGAPLIAHSIWQALHVPGIRGCFVSTEDDAIAATALEWGAQVIRRPLELAGDTAPTGPVLQHALREIEAAGATPDAVVLLQPTNPLRPLSLIEEALQKFEAFHAGHAGHAEHTGQAERVDSVMTVTRNHHKLGHIRSGLFVPQYVPGTRTQDLEPSYYENGLVYVTRAAVVRDRGDVFGERIATLETDALYALGDIDTLVDAQLAEFLFREYRERFSAPESKS